MGCRYFHLCPPLLSVINYIASQLAKAKELATFLRPVTWHMETHEKVLENHVGREFPSFKDHPVCMNLGLKPSH
jgi:hypothetical protein